MTVEVRRHQIGFVVWGLCGCLAYLILSSCSASAREISLHELIPAPSTDAQIIEGQGSTSPDSAKAEDDETPAPADSAQAPADSAQAAEGQQPAPADSAQLAGAPAAAPQDSAQALGEQAPAPEDSAQASRESTQAEPDSARLTSEPEPAYPDSAMFIEEPEPEPPAPTQPVVRPPVVRREVTREILISPSVRQQAKERYDEGMVHYERPDSLWLVFEQQPADRLILSPEDSSRFVAKWKEGYGLLQKRPNIAELTYDQKAQLVRDYERARDCFHEAATLNPTHENAQVALAITLERLARLHESMDEVVEAIEILESVRIGSPGRFTTLYYLGTNYLTLQQYDKALERLTSAEDVMIRDAFFSGMDRKSPVVYAPLRLNQDQKTHLFAVLVKKLECEEALGLTENAICTTQRVLGIAPDEHRASYDNKVENIYTYGSLANFQEIRKLWALQREERYEEARDLGLGLLTKLRGAPCYPEIAKNIATIEFHKLNEREEGYSRLEPVVSDILLKARIGKRDHEILNAFGLMSYLLGSDSEADPGKALEYYERCSEFEWEYEHEGAPMQMQGLCYYRLGLLWEANARKSSEYLQRALEAGVPPDYRCDVRESLINSLRRQGRFEEAEVEYKKMLQDCREPEIHEQVQDTTQVD